MVVRVHVPVYAFRQRDECDATFEKPFSRLLQTSQCRFSRCNEPFKGIWFAAPPNTCYDWLQLWWHSMKLVRCVFTSWQCRMSQLFPVWSCFLLDCSNYIFNLFTLCVWLNNYLLKLYFQCFTYLNFLREWLAIWKYDISFVAYIKRNNPYWF